MACDAWLALNGVLADIDGQTHEELDQALPTCWSHGNPIDVLGDATADRFRIAIKPKWSSGQNVSQIRTE